MVITELKPMQKSKTQRFEQDKLARADLGLVDRRLMNG